MRRRTTVAANRRPDYIERGSDQHAGLLGLRKATEDDGDLVYEGWTLQDPNMLGPTATERAIRTVLRQKVTELKQPMPDYQSDDPTAPFYAPPMMLPPKIRAQQEA